MKVSDIDWEIRQIWMAIDYYERAIENAYFRKDVEHYADMISSLMEQLRTLERKRDVRR
jgi:hypothetical protein|tara:strand:+ start:192 stop:368 length:177 start_codon:yes stop_codon:yes gene_type:complete